MRQQVSGQDQARTEHSARPAYSPVTAAARAVSALARGHRPGHEHQSGHRERSRRWPRRYKIQAMITLAAPGDDAAGPLLSGPSCRALIRARHHDTRAGRFFPALMDIRDDYAVPDDRHLVVTAVVLGDDASDYLGVGDEFTLWRGQDIGRGVVTRRVFV